LGGRLHGSRMSFLVKRSEARVNEMKFLAERCARKTGEGVGYGRPEQKNKTEERTISIFVMEANKERQMKPKRRQEGVMITKGRESSALPSKTSV